MCEEVNEKKKKILEITHFDFDLRGRIACAVYGWQKVLAQFSTIQNIRNFCISFTLRFWYYGDGEDGSKCCANGKEEYPTMHTHCISHGLEEFHHHKGQDPGETEAYCATDASNLCGRHFFGFKAIFEYFSG